MKLLLGILLFQCSLSVSAQNDVIRQWSYDINTEEGAPCSYDVSSNRLLLSGFDVTDDGFIYLAGGTPLRLACFDGSKVVFKKKIDEINSSSVFLKVRGDSVEYYVKNSPAWIPGMLKVDDSETCSSVKVVPTSTRLEYTVSL